MSKNNKTVSPNEIPSELLKLLSNKGTAAHEKLLNKTYEMGQYPVSSLHQLLFLYSKRMLLKM